MNRTPSGSMPQGHRQHHNQNPNQNQNNIHKNVVSRDEHRARQIISRDMSKYMNLSVDPCMDFYEYACGNWAGFHTRQLREGELGTVQQLVESGIVDQLLNLLKLPLPPPNHPNEYSATGAANVRKVCSFYDTCVAVEANAEERRQFLMKILQENGGLRNVPKSNYQPNVSWLQTLANLRRNYGLDILIGLSVDLNLQQMRGNSIYLGEPRLTIIPVEHCNALATQQANFHEDVFEQLQQQVADNMNDWFEMETGEAARFAGDLIRFEFELCKRMREHQSLPATDQQQESAQPPVYPGRSRTGQDRLRQQPGGSSFYPRMTLTELTSKLGNSLDFKSFVEGILEMNYVDYVYVRSQNYLEHVVRTAKANNHYTISGYILYLALLQLNQPPEEHAMLRPRQCVHVMQRLFPQVLGDMYQRKVHQYDAQHDIEEVFKDLVKAFDELLRVEWLNENDRRAARIRLGEYHTEFPNYQGIDLSELHFQNNDDYWRKLEITLKFNAREQFNSLRGNDFGQSAVAGLDAFEVRAALVPRKQTVLVGWGLLQTPYYNYFYPKALKYALLGHRLASALLMAFDNDGWNKHPQATATWSEQTIENYKNVSECQRAQYSNYLADDPSEFRNATRLREIIAEGGALNVAFKAYLNWLEQQDHKMTTLLSRETLPELNFTNTQLFFIYFAQTHCWAKPGEESPPEGMPLMQHTPQRWDVNGPLSNSEEFGREFGCALGSPMNSGNKCLIF
ncbi:neprilysin-4 [Drosophila innubila]|uniref:neprilysin-4 n=1 Tax=Drosophila innubila TaxID=198719 RepID=UPI00148C6799|nr:neprilysin-4 [Drosophila innubila]